MVIAFYPDRSDRVWIERRHNPGFDAQWLHPAAHYRRRAKDFEWTIESDTAWRFIASVNQVTHKIPVASTTLPRMAHGKGGIAFLIAPANLRF